MSPATTTPLVTARFLPETAPASLAPGGRLVSLDAYRGFVMLAMASSGLAISNVLRSNPDLLVDPAHASSLQLAWNYYWQIAAYQLDHLPWAGCTFWDLIQPSFMFMVGVAMPFSAARRSAEGQSAGSRWLHVLLRSLVLILLGVFLSSNGAPQTRFTYVNVLTQIGLGYPFLYLMLHRPLWVKLLVVVAVLGGYGAWFATYTMPAEQNTLVRQYASEVKKIKSEEFDQYTGLASHWNKHTNAAAAVDRVLLNLTPSDEKEWHGQRFWLNNGGYQTLNFIPSFVTMLFGLMTGGLLVGPLSPQAKCFRMWWTGGLCLLLGLACDTTVWPFAIPGCDWNICPIVKRIWTPSWAVFSTGWTLWMLAAFYWVIDIRGWKSWAFPFVVVGMNSIAMYCLAQLIKPWLVQSFKTHLTTVDKGLGTTFVPTLFDGWCGPIWTQVTALLLLWVICYWMYRRKIFVRI